MTPDAQRPKILDYRKPDSQPLGWAGAMRRQFVIAYVLMISPIIYVGMSSSVDPVPVDRAVTLYVLIGIAIGAGLFVARRQPRNVLGWLGFAGWGALCLGAIVNALLR